MKKIPIRQITHGQQLGTDTGRFTIRTVEHILNGKALLHPLHKHDFHFLLVLEKGKGLHEIDFHPYEVHDHSVFILRPGQVHQLQLEPGSTGFLAEFDNAFNQHPDVSKEKRWRQVSMQNYHHIDQPSFRKLLFLLANMHEEFTRKEIGFADAIRANLDLFYLVLSRQNNHENNNSTPGNNYRQEQFESFVTLLESNTGRMKTVAEYSSALNLSAYQLNAITKSNVGKTVSELIDDQLMLEAKRNLLATSGQVKEIADELGFEDPSYFIRFFKKHTGQSPEEFRRHSR